MYRTFKKKNLQSEKFQMNALGKNMGKKISTEARNQYLM